LKVVPEMMASDCVSAANLLLLTPSIFNAPIEGDPWGNWQYLVSENTAIGLRESV